VDLDAAILVADATTAALNFAVCRVLQPIFNPLGCPAVPEVVAKY